MPGVRPVFIATISAITLFAGGTATAGTARSSDCAQARSTIQGELAAACPCEGSTRHADYVRCVTKKLRELSECTLGKDGTRTCGPLPRACFGRIRKLASRSACGEPANVTCCLPKQHDCVGDTKPGDGKTDGVCSDSTRRCDRVTDCMLSKCQIAPSVERCRLAGGTLGDGKDCSTACTP